MDFFFLMLILEIILEVKYFLFYSDIMTEIYIYLVL